MVVLERDAFSYERGTPEDRWSHWLGIGAIGPVDLSTGAGGGGLSSERKQSRRALSHSRPHEVKSFAYKGYLTH